MSTHPTAQSADTLYTVERISREQAVVLGRIKKKIQYPHVWEANIIVYASNTSEDSRADQTPNWLFGRGEYSVTLNDSCFEGYPRNPFRFRIFQGDDNVHRQIIQDLADTLYTMEFRPFYLAVQEGARFKAIDPDNCLGRELVIRIAESACHYLGDYNGSNDERECLGIMIDRLNAIIKRAAKEAARRSASPFNLY